ncbi:hypothetical protein [Streptomyces triculaminicus]|uniref:hypothetical protein n=1 Tax=Streptomyces triculaminicus TaxID=2816232 RepID=UPI0037A05552
MTSWHLNTDRPYYTRHPEPADWGRGFFNSLDGMDLDNATLRRALAVHEAGHAALCFAFGVPVVLMHLSEDLGRTGPGFEPLACVRTAPSGWRISYMAYAALCAAGERAQDRWLREMGLWTPKRAWAAERAAMEDRRMAAAALKDNCRRVLHYGDNRSTGSVYYGTVQTVADSALSHLWDRVLRLAAALDDHGHLTGHEAARYAGMTTVAVPYEGPGAVAA